MSAEAPFGSYVGNVVVVDVKEPALAYLGHGVHVNRREVLIRLDEVVSVSRLDDIIVY